MKVKNFSGFMRSKLNESTDAEYDEMGMGMYGANPEDDDAALTDDDGADDEDEADEEPLTLEDLKAMIDELTDRVDALEGGEKGEETDEDTDEEGSDEAPDANESWRFNKSRRYNRY